MLRVYRFERRLKQVELAAMVGVNVHTITTWELGQSGPTVRVIPRLLEIIGEYREPAQTVAEAVRNYRMALGLSQREFARLQNRNESTIAHWETGSSKLTEEVQKALGLDSPYVRSAKLPPK